MTSDIDNRRASAWLLSDLCLNITALSLIKWMGIELAASQLVWARAAMGLLVTLPWAIRDRAAFQGLTHLPLHGLRILLAATTLTASFFAIARVPLALFTAINFCRPILLMILAALLLGESIRPQRWVIAACGLVGALIAVDPGGLVWTWGLPMLVLAVTLGSATVIVTRKLKGTPPVVMMVFYTAGLTLIMSPFAWWQWQAVKTEFWLPLLTIGVITQCAQYCFLKAHWLGDVGVLGPISYLSLVLSGGIGYLVFGEIPSVMMIVGSSIILAAVAALTIR